MDKIIKHIMNKGNSKERMIGRQLARGGSHPSVQKALSAVKKASDSINKAEGKDSFTPPAGVAAEAKKALQWIKEGHAGGGFTSTGRSRASQLASRKPVSLDTIKRMNSFLSRHGVDNKGQGFSQGEKGFPSPGRVSWAAWGGDPAKSWVKGILSRESNVKKALDAAKSARDTINKDGAGGGAGMGAAAPTGTGFASGGAPLTGSQVYTPTAGGTRTRKENKNVQVTKPRDADPIGGAGGMG